MTARTPCDQPTPCEDGELCARHEEEQAHAEGETALAEYGRELADLIDPEVSR